MVEQYTLKVVIDDSKIRELEKRLNNLGGGGGSSGAGSGGKGKGGIAGLFSGLGGGGSQGGMMKNLGKLAGIAVGIMAIMKMVQKISSLVVQSSPMLQGMLKLFNTSILMIFRPIGDFVGFFLRPIMIYFLRTVALPLYRYLAPIMRQWGSTLGNAFVEFLKNPLGMLYGILTSIDWWQVLKLFPIIGAIAGIWEAVKLLDIDLGEIALGISEAWDTALSTTLTTLEESWATLTGWFSSMSTAVTNTLKPAWDTLQGWVQSIITAFEKIWEFLQPLLNWLGIGDDSGGGAAREDNAVVDARGRSNQDNNNTQVYIVEPSGEVHAGSPDAIAPPVQEQIENQKRNHRFS